MRSLIYIWTLKSSEEKPCSLGPTLHQIRRLERWLGRFFPCLHARRPEVGYKSDIHYVPSRKKTTFSSRLRSLGLNLSDLVCFFVVSNLGPERALVLLILMAWLMWSASDLTSLSCIPWFLFKAWWKGISRKMCIKEEHFPCFLVVTFCVEAEKAYTLLNYDCS